MSPLWAIPAVLVVVGAVILAVLARRARSEAAGLVEALRGWTIVQPALVAVRDDLDLVRARLREQRRR